MKTEFNLKQEVRPHQDLVHVVAAAAAWENH